MGWLLIIAIGAIGALLLRNIARKSRADQQSKQSSRRSQSGRGRVQVAPAISVEIIGANSGRFGEHSRTAAKPMWLGLGASLEVAGFNIENPLTYTASNRDSGKSCADPSQIAPWLPVKRGPDPHGLSYWPWYEQLTPEQRWIHLSWMASGRRTLPPSDGFLFIYFYGLERRALVDKADLPQIVREVARLKALHLPEAGNGRGWSFQHYSTSFLWFLVASQPDRFQERDIQALVVRTHSWREESLKSALAWFASMSKRCPSWMAMVAAEQSPLATRSVVRSRVADEFEALFHKRFTEQFGEGLQLRTAARPTACTYQTASNALDLQRCEIPNVFGIQSQFKSLAAMWNSCVEDLRRLSRLAAKTDSEELTPENWEAMPPDLRKGIDHPLAESVCAAIAEHTNEAGRAFVRAKDFAGIVGIAARDRYTLAQSCRIAETVEHAGYAVEPDARLMRSAYKADECLSVFLRMFDLQASPKRYLAATCILRMGTAIAAADGDVSDEEMALLTNEVERAFDLNEHEERRLEALRELLLVQGSDIAAIGKRLRESLDSRRRAAVGRLLIAIAASDGVIHPGERKALRRCYRVLDLAPDQLDTALAELSLAAAEDMVAVKSGGARTQGEPIPAPVESDAQVVLNQAAIQRIMLETREVASMLAEAMGVEQSSSESPPPPPANAIDAEPTQTDKTATAATIAGPSGRYAAFFAVLIEQDAWPRTELEALARDQGLMLGGALEEVNEWAFETIGAALVFEDGETVVVERSLLEEV